MFEPRQQEKTSLLWKTLPVALGIFALLVAGAIYLTQFEKVDREELTGVLHKGDPDFDWYEKYLELRDPKIEMGLNFAGKRIVKFAGLIRNGGERSLDVVEVRLSFFNYDNLVWETARTPIRPGPYTPAIQPLTDRAFSLYFEEIPEGWKASHAEMSLEGFRFAESQ
jgi:hypothetical protein